MITFLLARGLAPWAAKLVAYVGFPVLLLLAAYLALDAWGDSRYRSGKADEKAAWIAASDKLLADAAKAKTEADRQAAAAAIDFAARQQDERNRIDAAIQNGASPVDALFPAQPDGVR